MSTVFDDSSFVLIIERARENIYLGVNTRSHGRPTGFLPTQNGGRSELARDLGVRDRQPSVTDGHEKTSEYQRPRLRFHPYVRLKRPSLRPDLPFPTRSSEWRSRMAVKATALAARSVLEGRSLLRDPRRRRGASGALPSSASGCPLHYTGSGSRKPIKYRARNPIKQRAHAHRAAGSVGES